MKRIAAAAVPLCVLLAVEAATGARQIPNAAASPEFFEARVRPVLAANCYDCHADQQYADLRVDSREALLKGGKSGPAIVPGDAEKSLLIRAVRQTDALKMPKGGKLKPEEVDALVAWVNAGAPWNGSTTT